MIINFHGLDVANKPEVESYTGSFGKTCRMFAVARKGSWIENCVAALDKLHETWGNVSFFIKFSQMKVRNHAHLLWAHLLPCSLSLSSQGCGDNQDNWDNQDDHDDQIDVDDRTLGREGPTKMINDHWPLIIWSSTTNSRQTSKNKTDKNHKPEVGRGKTGQGGLLHLLGDQNAGLIMNISY